MFRCISNNRLLNMLIKIYIKYRYTRCCFSPSIYPDLTVLCRFWRKKVPVSLLKWAGNTKGSNKLRFIDYFYSLTLTKKYNYYWGYAWVRKNSAWSNNLLIDSQFTPDHVVVPHSSKKNIIWMGFFASIFGTKIVTWRRIL